MHKKIGTIAALLLMVVCAACDLVDPSKIENPQITQDALMSNAVGGTTPLLSGLRRYFAIAHSNTALVTDIVSDNYDNRASYFSNILDSPREILPGDLTLNANLVLVPASASNPQDGMYFYLQNLRAMSDVGLATIVPNDATTTDAQKAEVHFYKGMALLMLSENFSAFPVVEDGPAVPASAVIPMAIEQLKIASAGTTDGTMKPVYKLALARAYRLAKDKANAVLEARAALALSASFVFSSQFDAATLANRCYGAAVARTSNDIQPLPRLDFLDPKFSAAGTPIAALKAEEAHLIIAEAAAASGDLAGARASMIDAITLAKSRTTVTYTDKDVRLNRPNDTAYVVKSDAASIAKAGLVKKHGGASVVVTSPVSNTSVTAADVAAMTTSLQLYRGVYLLRQEIFFFEGRRMSDLGIRLPLSQRQIDGNHQILAGSPATVVVVPAFIPLSDGLDQFTMDAAAKTVTIGYDLNLLIATNIAQVSPFLAP